jgi:hypothetical protein
MPSVVRPNNKAKKIAFKILGVPANMRKRSKKEQRTNEKLIQQETRLVR